MRSFYNTLWVDRERIIIHYVIIIYIHRRQHRLALASMTNCSDSQLLFSSCSVHAAGLCGKEMLRQQDRAGIVPVPVLTTTSNKLILGFDLNQFLVFVEMSKGYQQITIIQSFVYVII